MRERVETSNTNADCAEDRVVRLTLGVKPHIGEYFVTTISVPVPPCGMALEDWLIEVKPNGYGTFGNGSTYT